MGMPFLLAERFLAVVIVKMISEFANLNEKN